MKLAGQKIPVGCSHAVVLPSFDFETYSECPISYGVSRYTEHPSAEVLCLAYDLKNGQGPKLWIPGMPAPQDLFDHIASGGLLEAWNSLFEYFVWLNLCVKKLGWPPLPLEQTRDVMAKARAHCLPAALEKCGAAMGADIAKDKDGKRLIRKFCIPRKPTKKDARTRILLSDDPEDAQKLYDYCVQDVASQDYLSERIPDLSPLETRVWLVDQRMNVRGLGVDKPALAACMSIIAQAQEVYTKELVEVTDGWVDGKDKTAEIIKWAKAVQGFSMASCDKDHVIMYLNMDIPDPLRRVLRIRQLLTSASIGKMVTISNVMSEDGRIRCLLNYHGARTGRETAGKVQPQNLKAGGPDVQLCGCGKHYAISLGRCPWCDAVIRRNVVEWSADVVEDVLEIVAWGDLGLVEAYFEDAVAVVGSCVRGLICAGEGNDYISSDYSAIEGVVMAMLAGEQWRIDVFNTHGMIYEMSASKITGIPFEEFKRHKAETGAHHPMRKKVGKIAELAAQFGGGYNAWKKFGASEHIGEDSKIKEAVTRWRQESPMIVAFWRGLQEAAVYAVQNPGLRGTYRDITYGCKDGVLYCQLPSGRNITYHDPKLVPDDKLMYGDNEGFSSSEELQAVLTFGQIKEVERVAMRLLEHPAVRISGECAIAQCAVSISAHGVLQITRGLQTFTFPEPRIWKKFSLTFMGHNSDSSKGKVGWIRMFTYGGKLAENVVQAVARDIMMYATVNLEFGDYPLVLQVHDEVEAEKKIGEGSVPELEAIMSALPPWATGWPVYAKGGWRGRRYRKD